MLNMDKIMEESGMEEGKKYRRKELPKAVSERLDALIHNGAIVKTGKKSGTRYEMSSTPPWVEAAKEVLENQPSQPESPPATALTQFSLTIGNRAALIVQMCDALQTGQAGLSTIQEMKGQAILILRELNLIGE